MVKRLLSTSALLVASVACRTSQTGVSTAPSVAARDSVSDVRQLSSDAGRSLASNAARDLNGRQVWPKFVAPHLRVVPHTPAQRAEEWRLASAFAQGAGLTVADTLRRRTTGPRPIFIVEVGVRQDSGFVTLNLSEDSPSGTDWTENRYVFQHRDTRWTFVRKVWLDSFTTGGASNQRRIPERFRSSRRTMVP